MSTDKRTWRNLTYESNHFKMQLDALDRSDRALVEEIQNRKFECTNLDRKLHECDRNYRRLEAKWEELDEEAKQLSSYIGRLRVRADRRPRADRLRAPILLRVPRIETVNSIEHWRAGRWTDWSTPRWFHSEARGPVRPGKPDPTQPHPESPPVVCLAARHGPDRPRA